MSEFKETPIITEEEALKLLLWDSSTQEEKQDCFDRFGNYSFPTDFVIDTPNMAIGSSDGIRYLNIIENNRN